MRDSVSTIRETEEPGLTNSRQRRTWNLPAGRRLPVYCLLNDGVSRTSCITPYCITSVTHQAYFDNSDCTIWHNVLFIRSAPLDRLSSTNSRLPPSAITMAASVGITWRLIQERFSASVVGALKTVSRFDEMPSIKSAHLRYMEHRERFVSSRLIIRI